MARGDAQDQHRRRPITRLTPAPLPEQRRLPCVAPSTTTFHTTRARDAEARVPSFAIRTSWLSHGHARATAVGRARPEPIVLPELRRQADEFVPGQAPHRRCAVGWRSRTPDRPRYCPSAAPRVHRRDGRPRRCAGPGRPLSDSSPPTVARGQAASQASVMCSADCADLADFIER